MNNENVLRAKKEGFVPVQYRIINLTSDEIVNSATINGTMTVYKEDGKSYERKAEIHKVTPYTIDELKEKNMLITVADDILFYEIWKNHSLYDDDFRIYEWNIDNVIWGVQRVSPKRDKDNVKLNYQAEQTSNIQSSYWKNKESSV